MPATVHGGSLQRWLEKLCRIQVDPLRGLLVGGRPKYAQLPEVSGVYCFWWVGPLNLLVSKRCSRHLTLVGPNGRRIDVTFDDEWLGLGAGGPLPLYVGKTSAGMRKRAKQHLLLNRTRLLPHGIGAAKAPRPTTSCQLRAGIDQLFPKDRNTAEIVLDNVGLSYVELPGDDHAANRFYLENLAIGMMRPPLNIDVER